MSDPERDDAAPGDPGQVAAEAAGFGRLLAANLRVLGVALVLMGAAYGVWRGAAALFPEVEWLQGK